MRHDVDYDIASAMRMARREYRNGVRATYYFLNTAEYYSDNKISTEIRKPYVLDYMNKLQNEYKHEIGWHNDLVTLQIVYNVDVEKYLTKELAYLRNNGIRVDGSVYHGSEFCYMYHYLNYYIWKPASNHMETGPRWGLFQNFDSVRINGAYKKIKKFEFSDFGFKYEASLLKNNYFFADVFYFNKKRWNMTMFDWNSLKPGDRVIVLTHPALWD
jgi:hypothetical protein